MNTTLVVPAVEFIETAPYEKGFATHFKSKILPLMQEVEEHRLAQYTSYKRRKGIAIPITILAFIGAVYLEGTVGSEEADFIKIAIGITIGLFAWVGLPVIRYKENVKSKFMPTICSFFGNLTYALSGDTKVESQYEGEIFPSFNKQENEDIITGEYKGVAIAMHETTLKKKGNKSTYTVFKGLVLSLGLKKKFTGKTLLRKDAGSLGNFFTGKDFNGLTRVELEDPEFEAIFQVFSSDQVEARFVLTTAFMERLLNLAKLRSPTTPSVQCVFENDQLVIAVPSEKNLFEPGKISETVLKLDDTHNFLAEIKGVFDLVDVLKLK